MIIIPIKWLLLGIYPIFRQTHIVFRCVSDTTRQHAMPKRPSTCQKVCSRRHAKQVCLRQHAKRLSVDVPKWWCPSTCQEFVSVDMPKQRPIASQSLNPETSATRLARSTWIFSQSFYVADDISRILLCNVSLVTPNSARLWLQSHLACDSKIIINNINNINTTTTTIIIIIITIIIIIISIIIIIVIIIIIMMTIIIRARRRSDSVASCRCASTREDLIA